VRILKDRIASSAVRYLEELVHEQPDLTLFAGQIRDFDSPAKSGVLTVDEVRELKFDGQPVILGFDFAD
jgi:hypothetical protein